MEIDKELEEIFNDPLVNLSPKEVELFDVPEEMREVAKKRKVEYIAQHKLCEDFDSFRPFFQKVHQELRTGQRSLVRITKTANLVAGRYYIVDGQMLLLESISDLRRGQNFLPDGRTRCIYENGTESDILLQTLRKNVVGKGFAITELQEDVEKAFFAPNELTEKDIVTGYIYVLQSLSEEEAIRNQKDLYKIGFTTNSVEERIANAQSEPTYLMAPVKTVAVYKVVNLHSQKFEDILHQVLKSAQFHITVVDEKGNKHIPKEWFVVPLDIVDSIIEKIVAGTIANHTYNPELKSLEKVMTNKKSSYDTTGMKVLTLNIKKACFDEIIKGTKKTEERVLKQSTVKRYTYLDESDGKRYIRRYDALRLFVDYHNDRESALVEIVDTTFAGGLVTYHLGQVLEHIGPSYAIDG